jgi:RNA polymerase sigma-70 factor, ECF subfamily
MQIRRKFREPFRGLKRLYRYEDASAAESDRSCVKGSTSVDDLAQWLEEGYPQSVRTAYLILGNRADAEDAVQEAFLRAWKFRNALAKETSVRPWLYRVVVNTCNSKLRQEIPRRERHDSEHDLDATLAEHDMTDRFAATSDVARALKDLPLHLRVVVVLRYYADLNEREIAIAIGRKPGTVKSRLHEARRRLADHPALRDSTTDPNSEEVSG